MNEEILQGDVFLCDFGECEGSIQGGLRPCLVVSNNKNNYYSNVVIVVPITSQNKKSYLPMHYMLYKKDYDFFHRKENTVLTEQIRCVNTDMLKKKLGRIDILDLMHIIEKLNINFKEIELY
jgi:mRNA interferase MazF